MICPRLELLEGPMAVVAVSGFAAQSGLFVRSSSRKEPAAAAMCSVQCAAKERCPELARKDTDVQRLAAGGCNSALRWISRHESAHMRAAQS